MLKVILKAGKAKPFWSKEPLVFSGAIQKIEGQPAPAELVTVWDAEGNYLGWGMFNPHSLYRVRLLSFSGESRSQELEALLMDRFKQAQDKRRAFNLPNADTNAYRLLNSEADGLSGLTIDVLNHVVVVSSTAYWVEAHRPLIEAQLDQLLACEHIVWRSQVKALHQEGWFCQQGAQQSHIVEIAEHGLSFHVDVGHGQKTGFYCDQRDNRKLLRSLAQGRRVLDCFCYTGGFALNAAKGGAERVLGVDSARFAIQLAEQNATLNQLKQVSFLEQTVEETLEAVAHDFDCIVLDPPKLAPHHKNLMRSKHQYLKLNLLALKGLKSGGLLMTFSCSDAMSGDLLLSLIRSAAEKANRRIHVKARLAAGADHPYLPQAHYGQYLKGFLIEVK